MTLTHTSNGDCVGPEIVLSQHCTTKNGVIQPFGKDAIFEIWLAEHNPEMAMYPAIGSTPEEALANLHIAGENMGECIAEEIEKEEPKLIYWLRAGNTKVFHAYTLHSGVSLCRTWFMGGRAPADDWYKGQRKCRHCLRARKVMRDYKDYSEETDN